MSRIRLIFAVCLFALVVAAPVAAQESEPAGPEPAVVLEGEPEALEEEAWTFRFLVPTLLLGTGLAVFGVVAGYGLRVRSRYRVTQ